MGPSSTSPSRRWGAVDVHYFESGCRAAVVIASDEHFEHVIEQHVTNAEIADSYEPGALYKRELPPIRSVLALTSPLQLLVVDGYVTLDANGRAGLGAHAHRAFGMPVIGVAKSAFRGATHAIEVLRGSSSHPLYVTAIGVEPADAAEVVRSMAGANRIPDAIKLADRLARGLAQPPQPA